MVRRESFLCDCRSPTRGIRAGVDLQVVVPYAALALPSGEHEMAYEIRGLRGEMVDFVRATPMVAVKVSDRNRKTMVERARPSQWGTQKIERDAYVLKNGVLKRPRFNSRWRFPSSRAREK